MTASKNDLKTFQLVVRWTARITSILVILVFILMFKGEGFTPARLKPTEWGMLLFGPLGLMLGMILGWWNEGLGGAITLLSYFGALLVGGYSASGAGYFLVCAAPGLLFLLSWFLSQWVNKKTAASAEEAGPVATSPGAHVHK